MSGCGGGWPASGGGGNPGALQVLNAPAWATVADSTPAPPTLDKISKGTFPGTIVDFFAYNFDEITAGVDQRIQIWTFPPATWASTQLRYRIAFFVENNVFSAPNEWGFELGARAYQYADGIAQTKTTAQIDQTTGTTGTDKFFTSDWSAWITPAGTPGVDTPVLLDFTRVEPTGTEESGEIFFVSLQLEFQ